jgi:hypothetical protein
VADDLPVALDLDLAFVRSVIDLARTRLAHLSLDGAFNDLEIHLGKPEVETRLTFDGAFSRYRIVVPADVSVLVDEDGPFHSIDGRSGERSGPGYRVRVEGAFTRVEVESE